MKPWLKAVFALSLALNLAIAGAVIVSFVKMGGGHGAAHARMEALGGPLTRALSKEERRELGQQMRTMLRDGREDRVSNRAILEDLLVALRAEPFDRAAVADHMARQRGFVLQRMELGQGLLLDRLEGMSPEARAAFADRLYAGLQKKREARE
jgi:uncharacterized membrane protein